MWLRFWIGAEMDLPSCADAPFHCPPDVVLDLPYPPSVNKLWRSTAAISSHRVYLAPSYVKWKAHADALLMSVRGFSTRRVTGHFSIDIDLCPPAKHPRGDLDNRIKAVLDFLQRSLVIQNDKDCQRLVAQWVPQERAPHGCRVTVRPCT